MGTLIERKDCPMRHENGNCTAAGGFCTAVNDTICEALHNAFNCGEQSKIEWATLAIATQTEKHQQETLKILREMYKKIEKTDLRDKKPLTIEELRQMHGEPVWIEQENAWGIVNVVNYGDFKNEPFVTFYYKSVMRGWNIVKRGLTCYRHNPEKHGRWVHNEDYEEWAEKYVCSVCNRNALTDGDYRHELTDYCPDCGARMLEDE